MYEKETTESDQVTRKVAKKHREALITEFDRS